MVSGIEAQQRADSGRRAERADNARPMPAAGAKHRIIEPDADPRRHFRTDSDGDQKITTGQAVAFRDHQRRRHDLRRDVGHGRAMHVAHRRRGDEIGVEQRRAGQRQMPAADHARFAALRQRGGKGRDLTGFFAPIAGNRAGERIQQKILAMLADPRRQIVVGQRCGKFCQYLCGFRLLCCVLCFFLHRDLPACRTTGA